VEAALLASHAQWALDRGDARPAAAARRLAASGIDLLSTVEADDSRLLLDGRPTSTVSNPAVADPAAIEAG
jgi:hypothetical protein